MNSTRGVHVVQSHPLADSLAGEVEAAVARAMNHLDVSPDVQLTVVLTTDAELARLNAAYRGKSGPTDVLSFVAAQGAQDPGEPPYLGDVIISCDRARAQADALGHTVREEVRLLAVHGLLHLLGHEDETETGAQIMEALERDMGLRH